MVFSSVLLYLDPPHWQQQPNHQPALQGSGVGGRGNDHNPNQHLIPPPPLPQPPQSQVGMGGGGGGGPGAQPIHPHLTAERARLAKIHPPLTPLKCPRCESTITKFCYYNNYNPSQPRHFCKSCRRYWTQGGALRNVPVGGGCRRSHKRSSSKSSSGGGGGGSGSGNGFSSKSPPTAMVGGDRLRMPLHMDLLSTSCTSPTISGIPSAGGGTGMSPFMASLQNIAQLGMGNLGLSFGGSLNMPPHHHPLGGFSGEDGSDLHRLDFPQLNPNSNNQQMRYSNTFLEGFEIPSSSVGAGLYNSSFQQHHHQQQQQKFDDDDHHDLDDQVENLHKSCPSSMNSQFEPVKMEVVGQEGLNINKQFMAAMSSSDNNAMGNRFWDNSIGNGNNIAASSSMWTHLSSLNNSSSTSHLL